MNKTEFAAPALDLTLDPSLPITGHAARLIRSIQTEAVNIICGATGSGKSTQLPKLCLQAGRRQVAHTQPRRIAARTLAQRIASEMGSEVGDVVGWQVRFAQAVSAQTRVKLMTDGVLLAELRRDQELRRYDTIIIDEAHERSLNIDFLLGCLHRLLPRRPELRLIITSATLDTEKFSAHFGGAPIHQVEGRSYPVETRYRDGDNLLEATTAALRELWREAPGGVLVFLPGEREIRDLREGLAQHAALRNDAQLEILPLYARLPASHQQRIFSGHAKAHRVVLATNVAETSLTVPGIRYVIDTGLARIARFSPRTQLQSLAIEPIAQDACNQRAGRCGRTAPGICIRLYSEEDFLARDLETAPEILRSNLADVVLQMADRRLGRPQDFPFVDTPEQRRWKDAQRLLQQLGALDDDGALTRLGKRMARLPVEPRFSRMLVEAAQLGCVTEVIVVVAALSMQDVREHPPEQREAAAQAHAPFRDKQSDFQSLLNLHSAIRAAREELSQKGFNIWCRKHFLHARRVREWLDLCHQLHRELRAQNIRMGTGGSAHLHRALLCGLLDHLGQHHEQGEYRGPRGQRWRIHPESGLRRVQASWVFAASIVSTRRPLARQAAITDARTILSSAGPLVRRQPIEPGLDARRGEVMCREECRLFGMLVDDKKRVPLARYDTQAAREIFLREALVNGRWGGEEPRFLRQNRSLLMQLRRDEERLRRRDLLIGEEQQYAFYAARIPEAVHSRHGLEDALDAALETSLCWSEEELRQSAIPELDQAWPTRICIRGQTLRLRYRFAPGEADDGVSVELPLEAVAQLRAEDFIGQIPGLAEMQLEALLKGLPKADRRQLIPLASTIHELQAAVSPGRDFLQQCRLTLAQRLGHPLRENELAMTDLAPALQLRYLLRDGKRLVAAGRNLDELRKLHCARATEIAQHSVEAKALATGLLRFPEPCPPLTQTSAQGTPLRLVFRDTGQAVDIALCTDPELADEQHQSGLRRLAWLRLKSRLSPLLKELKNLRGLRQLAPLPGGEWDRLLRNLGSVAQPASLGEATGLACIEIPPAAQEPASTRASFEDHLETRWPEIRARLEAACQALHKLDKLWPDLRMQLAVVPAEHALHNAASLLLHPGFIYLQPDWVALPKYLAALQQRHEKWRRDPATDEERESRIAPYEARLLEFMHSAPPHTTRETLRQIFWALQDYRVSLFAQELGVPHPVSPKRLEKLFALIHA